MNIIDRLVGSARGAEKVGWRQMTNKIRITKSSTADTRTCDWANVTQDMLRESSEKHIDDVRRGIELLRDLLLIAGKNHDRTKLSHINEFFADFKTGFKNTEWWIMHQREERHHFSNAEFVRDDVNLIDVLEQITDGVMAGMARSGQYRCEPPTAELLRKAYDNTAKMLVDCVVVVSDA